MICLIPHHVHFRNRLRNIWKDRHFIKWLPIVHYLEVGYVNEFIVNQIRFIKCVQSLLSETLKLRLLANLNKKIWNKCLLFDSPVWLCVLFGMALYLALCMINNRKDLLMMFTERCHAIFQPSLVHVWQTETQAHLERCLDIFPCKLDIFPWLFDGRLIVLSCLIETTSLAPSTEDAFVRLAVIVDPGLNVFGDVLGWVYTIAWDISFFPQIVHNWRRRRCVPGQRSCGTAPLIPICLRCSSCWEWFYLLFLLG